MIHGSWKLISFDLGESANSLKPWGEQTTGLLIYSPDGGMSVSINSSSDILFYSGTYIIEGNKITHQVTNASDSNRIGQEMIRYFEVSNDQIVLTGESESGKFFKLVWRR